jgi:sulfide:quinone oxidoreductase
MPCEVVICGGGVAALEAAGAVREHAGNRVRVTLIAPEAEFVYRPLVPASAFGYPDPPRVALDQVVAGVDATVIADRVSWIDRSAQVVHTDAGAGVAYDALIVCVGATPRVVYEHALTIDGRATGELDALIAGVQTGEVERLAFVAHDRLSWPLPLYEAALMTATLAAEAGRTPQLTIVTPESWPLEVFGGPAGRQMKQLFTELGFDLLTDVRAEVPDHHQVIIGQTGGTELQRQVRRVDRVVALPELVGSHLRGLPSGDHGFIPTDHYGRVRGEERVFAAGDATDFAVKHGGLAAQQADVVARGVAVLAGAAVSRQPFRPKLEGLLLTGGVPRFLSAQLVGGHAFGSEVLADWPCAPQPKIVAAHLNNLLDPRRAPTR